MSDRDELVHICHKVYQQRFVSAFDGNISLYTKNNTILITRSAVCKGDVTTDDLLELNSAGEIIAGKGKISTEYKIHLYAYSKRKEVNAVVHCHPVYATAFASAGEGFTKKIFPEVILTLGNVPLCEYATPSTDALPLSMEPYIEHAWAFLFRNHGAVTLGRNVNDAYFKMEKLEHAAKTLFAARMLGGEQELAPDKVKELITISKDVYGININEKNVL